MVKKKFGRGEYAKDNKQNQTANGPLPGAETFGMKDYMKSVSGIGLASGNTSSGLNNSFVNNQNQTSNLQNADESSKEDDDDDDKEDDD